MSSDMSIRVTTKLWLYDDAFKTFFDTMKRIGTIRDIAFFTHDIHTAPSFQDSGCLRHQYVSGYLRGNDSLAGNRGREGYGYSES